MGPPMPNPMVCHILEGEMQIDQDGKVFTAKKNFCSCNKDTKEQASNGSNAVAVMRNHRFDVLTLHVAAIVTA
jgi:hypothetical protein